MLLDLSRSTRLPTAILGNLRVDGLFECYTLEDPDGAHDRIDAGTYNVIINFSNRFQKEMPLVTGPKVDGRGIRIHCGNTQADTIGCILVGTGEDGDTITGSRDAFKALFPKLQAAIASGDTITLLVH